MNKKSQTVKLLIQVMILLGTLLSISYADNYSMLIWKVHEESPFRLVIKLNKQDNSFAIRRFATKNREVGYQWEEFTINPDVDKYEEQYIYSFLKQLFSITEPYTDFSQDTENSEAFLCKSDGDNCIRVSTQLFGREDGESTFCKYISQLKWRLHKI